MWLKNPFILRMICKLLKDGLTGAVQEKCDELVAEGELDRDFCRGAV